MGAPSIGLFACHCGHNIAGRVDVDRLVEAARAMPGVVHATQYPYMCSEPGQRLLREAIVARGLDAVVVASCSPRLHEQTFRRAAHAAGLNPYRLEIANVREQCSWIHRDPTEATAKAIRLVATAAEQASRDQALEPLRFPVTQAALVIGGGIAGIQAALDLAAAGQRVYLVERQASIGGNMARLSETFPTLDCAQCTLTPKMVEVASHPLIELLTCAEVEAIEGYVGNFKARIRQRDRHVDWDLCTGCGACIDKCPSAKAPSEFELGLAPRKAIHVPFPQAVPNKPTIDAGSCLWFGPRTKSGKRRCGACLKICPTEAIRLEGAAPQQRELEVGAVVVATGFELYERARLPEYGGDRLPDVIDALQLERLLSASGPTAGELRRPSDGEPVRSIAFVQCAGSRDENHKRYCSKVCCMYSTKQALLLLDRVPEAEAYLFYIDLRHAGRDYEEFLVRAQQAGARYIRGKVTAVQPGDPQDPEQQGKLVVRAEDTLSQRLLDVPVDLVVLATAMQPAAGADELARTLRLPLTEGGFFAEAHLKLRPVESSTAGFYLAGTAQGPRDIPETVAQASAAAAKALGLLTRDELQAEPTVASVDAATCIGCSLCVDACPAAARELDEQARQIRVLAALCQGCGACAPSCPTGAADMLNFTDDQLMAMTERALCDGGPR